MYRIVSFFCVATALLALYGCNTIIKVPVPNPAKGGYALQSVSIGAFHSRERQLGQKLSNALSGEVQRFGYLTTSPVSPNLVVGDVSLSRLTYDKWSEAGKKNTSYYYQVKQRLTVTFKVSNNGRTLISDTFTFSHKDKELSFESYAEAKADLDSKEKIEHRLLKKAAYAIAQYVSPYPSTQKVRLLDGEDDSIDLGMDYVSRKRYSQAIAIFEQVANKTTSTEDQAVSLHNIGMVHLIQSDHKKAFEFVSKANRIDPKNLRILDSLELVEKLKVKYDQMKEYR